MPLPPFTLHSSPYTPPINNHFGHMMKYGPHRGRRACPYKAKERCQVQQGGEGTDLENGRVSLSPLPQAYAYVGLFPSPRQAGTLPDTLLKVSGIPRCRNVVPYPPQPYPPYVFARTRLFRVKYCKQNTHADDLQILGQIITQPFPVSIAFPFPSDAVERQENENLACFSSALVRHSFAVHQK